MKRAGLAAAPGLLALTGCAAEHQSSLHPGGAEAGHILGLFLIFAGVCAAVYLLVVVALALAVLRHRPSGALFGVPGERALDRTLAAWTGFIATTLFVLTISAYAVDQRIAIGSEAPDVKIRMTARQWWWQVDYEDGDPHLQFQTANELQLPVGRTTIIELHATDVIHSFWIPNLHGKKDMIPGRVGEIRLRPSRVGRYRGECAEFCGLQHAHMAFDVAVVPARQFDAWRERQRQPARPPASPSQRQGHDFFVARECASCHQVRGTQANGRLGPDLTHVASRASLAAGTLPNRRGQLAAWLADPQGIKPGTHMPYVGLEPDSLHALVDYLGSLQ